ncbi:MAG: hypothetical protein V4749_15295 [Pseudomonadota bacterium]
MIGIIGSLIGGLMGGGARSSSTTDPLERQKQYALQMENRQADAAIMKMGNDTRNAIASGVMDSANKANNTMSSTAKEIRY